MATTVNIHEAKTHLSQLLLRVSTGEEIIIAKAGTPIARLVPINEQVAERLPGSAKGLITLAPDFDDPLPEDILADFER
jgi:prevent-host-death family protein